MKRYLQFFRTTGFILVLLFFAQQAWAQSNVECFFTDSPNPEDRCIAIGYSSVTPHIKQPGEPPGQDLLDVAIVFQACEDVTSISITRTQGPPIVIAGDDITGEIQDTTFTVNAKPFQNGNDLRVFIEFVTGGKTVLDIVYTGEEECETLNPLPVELISFKGIPTKSGINLKWRTASEKDNKQFEIERSADGYDFQQIGIVAGHGTSSVLIDYSFEDRDPINGSNYYRLKQVDLDGKYQYSNVIVAESTRTESTSLVVAPNPCINGDCILSFGRSGIKSETLIELKDMAGRVVFSRTLAVGDDGDVRLDELRSFKGLYLLTATSGNTVTNQRLVLE